ncbi:MAG: DegT/DnrJ/EryC1/StrS aminotransferase family protein, partial [Gemmatimonadetes bacterium]|nr:DegT/DnrJ/EryC1/StrS aminotransferase family protein [Gemmatimonadota bacterium]
KGRMLGALGDIGCFSFQATENLTTGDGGMLVTDDAAIADRVRKLRWAGISRPTWERFRSGEPHRSWIYEVEEIGYKYEMNDLAAAIGLVQLDKLEALNERRRNLLQRYREAFADIDGIEVLTNRKYAVSACYNAVIKVEDRDGLYRYLDQRGIDSNVHFYPNHLMGIFKPYTTRLPVTEREWERILVLPLHPELSEEQQDRVIAAVRSFASGRRR